MSNKAEHEDGRACYFDQAEGFWTYVENERFERCERTDHPVPRSNLTYDDRAHLIEVGKDYEFQPFTFDKPKKATVVEKDLEWDDGLYAGLPRKDGVKALIDGEERFVAPSTLRGLWEDEA